jgi:hypothetical protein
MTAALPRDPILRVLNELFEREAREADAVREEIKQRGTYWA